MTVRLVMPDYFRTMGMPVLRGRAIDESDTAETAGVLAVNEEFVRRYVFSGDAIGERLIPDLSGVGPTIAIPPGSEWEIVGVVGNIRAAGLDPAPLPMVYLPYAQAPIGIMNLLVRTRDAPETIRRAAERAVWSLGRNMNIYSVETLDRRLGNLLWQPRFASQLLGLFSVLALILGAAGIYAVLSYSVSRRSQEMGVRIALGADSHDLLRLVIGGGLRLVAVGLLVGGLASYGVARLLTGLLYGVQAADLATHLAVALIIAAVSVVACVVPALRASRVDPIEALRAE